MLQDNEFKWYAVYTAPRAEKKVSERFSEIGVEHYLPLQKVKRRWSDRIKEVEMPVIQGYIFVNILPNQFETVLRTYGAIAFVRHAGMPASIPSKQIQQLRLMVDGADEPINFQVEELEKGKLVKIRRGSLEGLIGELVEIQGKHKVLVRLERIGIATITVPLSFLELVD